MHKAFVATLLLIGGMCGANAEVWRAREGQCGEWRSRWNVEQDQDGVWTGSVDHEHIGGRCVQETGTRVRSNVRASIAGENFFATREFAGGQFCSYFGQIQQDRVRGVELCEGSPTRMDFRLRFPASADASQPRQPLRCPYLNRTMKPTFRNRARQVRARISSFGSAPTVNRRASRQCGGIVRGWLAPGRWE
jgi:hypothetical protein